MRFSYIKGPEPSFQTRIGDRPAEAREADSNHCSTAVRTGALSGSRKGSWSMPGNSKKVLSRAATLSKKSREKTGGQMRNLKPGDTLVFSYEPVNGINVANRIAPSDRAIAAGAATSAPSRTTIEPMTTRIRRRFGDGIASLPGRGGHPARPRFGHPPMTLWDRVDHIGGLVTPFRVASRLDRPDASADATPRVVGRAGAEP